MNQLNISLVAIVLLVHGGLADADEIPNSRRPTNDADLRYWLQNMVWHHRFTQAEITSATGLSAQETAAALKKFDIKLENKPKRSADSPLLVLPYPGGRHPRIGFLDGAVRPQRETKVSVFTPWDDASHVVVDVPEAIWCNQGLLYLAHTHVPTIWTKQNVELPPLEWNRRDDGSLDIERKLPNGVVFGAKVVPAREAVRMELWLTNGSKEKLSDLRVQNCVMLKGAAGFNKQTNDNKVFSGPYVACKSEDGKRWIITAWDPLHRGWANPPCPCLHSDPKFPDCAPGETKRLRGWLSFYEGNDIEAEFRRIEKTGWKTPLAPLTGSIVDAETGKPVAARVYLQGEDGAWHFPRSQAKNGAAVQYRKQRQDNPRSVEMHTTLSAHPFIADVPPGKYTLTVERGKEYFTETQTVDVGKDGAEVKVKLRRWADMAQRGWYSGETHVHRTLDELPTLILAEDLNVTFPLLYWVTDAFAPPSTGSRGPLGKIDPRVLPVDATHVIYPMNTEYEIFTVDKKRHTLGAFFALNHQKVLDKGVPPVKEIAERVHREGGLIEMDKHNWPWSMALVPLMKPDLFELTNNHIWRTEFAFSTFGEPAPDYMKIERDDKGFTEWGWIDYGFKNYYALLNCGFRLRPTAGTASGVHPVPLGYGRVYVHCPDGFSYEAWVRGLDDGRSFVTTGPMLLVQLDGNEPGSRMFKREKAENFELKGSALSSQPLNRIEVVVNGEIVTTLRPENRRTKQGGYECAINRTLRIDGSSWVAVRCFEGERGKRERFAHTAPFYIDVAGQFLKPRPEEVAFLIKRVEEQIERSKDVLPKAALDEYREALRVYKALAR